MSSNPDMPGGSSDAVIAAWRASTLTVVGLWCVAAIGFVPLLEVLSTPGRWWVTSIFVGVVWAGMFVALSRPFIEVRPSGCTYRVYGRVVHEPWSEIECVLMTPSGEQPRVLVLRRSPEALIAISVLADGWSATARRNRARSLVEAAAPFVSTTIPRTTAPVGTDKAVLLSRRRAPGWLDVGRLLAAFAVLAILLFAGWSMPSSPVNVFMTVGFGLVGLGTQRANQRTAATWAATSVHFDPTGTTFEFRTWPRRKTIWYPSDDIARITVHDRRLSPGLVIVLSDNSSIDLRGDLLRGRDSTTLTSLAQQLEAVAARWGR